MRINEKSWRWMAQVAFAFAIVVISYLAFSSDPPEITTRLSDKVNHTLAFLVLAMLLDQAFVRLSFVKGIVLPLLAYGLFIEAVQGQLGYREMSWLDVVADGSGIAVYAIFRERVRLALVRFVVIERTE